MLWTIFLLLNGLLILVLLYSTRRRQKNEPPLDKGLIPWLGHALEFGKDAAKFLARMKEKHGDIFTVCVAGHYVTVLLDPNSFDAIINDTVFLDFTRARNQLLKRIFSLQLPSIKPTSGTETGAPLQRIQGLDVKLVRSARVNMAFTCVSGRLRYCRVKYNSRISLKPPTTSSRVLHQLAVSVITYMQFFMLEDVSACLVGCFSFQCNAGPAAFWLLGFLLTHPEAMEAVKSEIRCLTLQDTSLQHPPINPLEAHSTPVFDSVLSETLRLTAAVMINREVVQDKILRMANGKEYHLRQGDRVCLFPFLSPQMDPEIHQDPQIFKYDRFLNEDITVKDKFYKKEKRLKYYTLPWGAGKNICVGKEFAVTAIKQFVFLLLTHLDMEMCDPEAKLPPVNPSRYGFGMLQPDGDLQVRYRLKMPQHKM
uniref:Prostacyclin synthase n=1 Tax=Seriola lalandi dorsalis TaxID=1841481 RepID=A0A3B4WIE5_SERLL